MPQEGCLWSASFRIKTLGGTNRLRQNKQSATWTLMPTDAKLQSHMFIKRSTCPTERLPLDTSEVTNEDKTRQITYARTKPPTPVLTESPWRDTKHILYSLAEKRHVWFHPFTPHFSALRVQEENKQSQPELKDVFSFAVFYSKVVATFLSAVAFIELFMMASHFKVLFGREKSRFRIKERPHPLKRKNGSLNAI